MKLQITHLKAPWPLGTVVGDVIELLAVPVWAKGKCERVTEDAEPTVAFAQPEPVRDLAAELEQAQFERDDLAQKLEHANSNLSWSEQCAKDLQAALEKEAAKSGDLAAQIAKRAADDALLPTVTGDGTGKALPPADDTEKTGKAKK